MVPCPDLPLRSFRRASSWDPECICPILVTWGSYQTVPTADDGVVILPHPPFLKTRSVNMMSTVLAMLIAVAWLAYIVTFSGRRRANLPPGWRIAHSSVVRLWLIILTGPKTLPVLGNLHQLPKEKTYLKCVLDDLSDCCFHPSSHIHAAGSMNGRKNSAQYIPS